MPIINNLGLSDVFSAVWWSVGIGIGLCFLAVILILLIMFTLIGIDCVRTRTLTPLLGSPDDQEKTDL
jgi:hypothetical protein